MMKVEDLLVELNEKVNNIDTRMNLIDERIIRIETTVNKFTLHFIYDILKVICAGGLGGALSQFLR